MTSISGINSASQSMLAAAPQGSNALGEEDFLTLLVAQLEHQDPLNPADPTEFTSQLAQFSSLEQLFAVNDSLKSLASTNSELERISALSLVGSQVIVSGNEFKVNSTGNVNLGYELGAQAVAVTIAIQDGTGRTVATLNPAELGAGDHFIAWDGLDQSGHRVAPGNYTLQVKATAGRDKDGKDQPVTASPLISGLVTGVDMDSTGNMLLTSAGEFKLSAVKGVRGI